jgi:UDP-N-acetylmuramoylalanine--D-glutamate ligase
MKKNYGFKNKKVTIMGLGLHGGGVGSAKFFAEEGAKVIVTDIKSKDRLASSVKLLKKYKNISFVMGQHRTEDFASADLIIKNPAIDSNSKYLDIAKQNRVPIKTDIDIFLDNYPGQTVGVTGTKGKSTTVSLLKSILEKKFDDVVMAGNVRVSVLEQLKKATKKSICILELSSAQLEDLATFKKSPHISIILNILPDHLNRHKSFQSYIEAKKVIFAYQKRKDLLILNQDDQIVKSFSHNTKAKILFFGKEKTSGAYEKKNGAILFGEDNAAILKKSDYSDVLGGHNVSNLLAAVTVAKIHKVSNEDIGETVKAFKKPEGRLELIRKKKGIKFYNDTSATMPDAAICGIRNFLNKNIILIAGGEDKGLDYALMAEEIILSVKKLILFEGTASDKLIKELRIKTKEKNKSLKKLLIEKSVNSMTKAVSLAMDCSEKSSNIILLSPGAASFNMFENEFDRGDQFNKAVLDL